MPARNLQDGKLVARATRLVVAYVVSLALLIIAVIAGYLVLREEMVTQKNLSEANSQINIINRTINESVNLIQDYNDEAGGVSPPNERLVQVIERRIYRTIEELNESAMSLKVVISKLETSAHWDEFKWVKLDNEEDRILLLSRYIAHTRHLVDKKMKLGQADIRPQVPSEAAGARHGSLSRGFRETSERLSDVIAKRSDLIENVHLKLTFLVLGTFLLMSLLIVLPLWKRLISEHKRHEQANEKLHQLAYTDQETGLPNLDGFEQYFFRKALPKKTVHNHYLLLVRIRNLHEIYNLIGSQKIMELHREFSERLRSKRICQRQWSRSGDAEYATVIDQNTFDKSDEWVELFYNDLSRPVIVAGILVRPLVAMAASQLEEPKAIGSSLLREHQANARMALPYFDRTLLKLPSYKAALTQQLTKQNEIITAVTNGVVKNEFVPFYQIKVDAISGKPNSIEVLCRWQRADGALICPLTFIPAAEKSGQIVPMTYQLLDQVVDDVENWVSKGLNVGPVAINVSLDVLQHKDFITRVCRARELLLVAGSDLEIEITENVVIENSTGAIRQILQSLSKCGIRIAIDDFGTGYASLQTLIDLPFDVLKIDRSFVVSMTKAGVGSEVLPAMISLISKLEKRSVIEGVEFEWQREKLVLMGADELQGYFFHKPSSAEDTSQWLARGQKLSAVSKV